MRIRHSIGSELASAKVLLATIEASKEFKECAAVLEPLIAEIAALEAEEEKRRLERQRNEAALSGAREAAKKRALESVDKDPEVVKAVEKLQVSM